MIYTYIISGVTIVLGVPGQTNEVGPLYVMYYNCPFI